MRSILHHIAILIIVVSIIGTACNHSTDNKAMSAIRQLPKFKLLSLDSASIVSSEAIPTGHASVFFYFDPECDHCQKVTKGIAEHQSQFDQVQFYFLSNSTINEIRKFRTYFGLDTMRNVFVGTDYQYSFYNVFLPPSIPYVTVYDHAKKLKKIYYGEADIQSLITNTRD